MALPQWVALVPVVAPVLQVVLAVQLPLINRHQTGLDGQIRPYKLSFLFPFAIGHRTPIPDQPELTNDC